MAIISTHQILDINGVNLNNAGTAEAKHITNARVNELRPDPNDVGKCYIDYQASINIPTDIKAYHVDNTVANTFTALNA